jgi:GNAT superfamily N-acetyltransferase
LPFLSDSCTFRVFDSVLIKESLPFNCGHKDLNEFFLEDCILYSKELLGKTYCFTLDEAPQVIVCAFTISNDSIKTTHLPNARTKKVNKDVPRVKQSKSYPAVLIGRLGVNIDYKGKNIGTELMEFIKAWFIDSGNKTGCRYVVVDSYNEANPINYYTKNGFTFLFGSEDQEKEYFGFDKDHMLKTRLMFFDLIILNKIAV